MGTYSTIEDESGAVQTVSCDDAKRVAMLPNGITILPDELHEWFVDGNTCQLAELHFAPTRMKIPLESLVSNSVLAPPSSAILVARMTTLKE